MNALSIGIPSKSQTVNVLRDNTDYELFEIAPEKSFLCVCPDWFVVCFTFDNQTYYTGQTIRVWIVKLPIVSPGPGKNDHNIPKAR